MSFQIHSLPREAFEKYFDMSDEQLSQHKAVRSFVQECPGTPCRISLEDAKVGEEVILVNYQHQDADSPYQSSHAVFVRCNGTNRVLERGEIPDFFRSRQISVRPFDADGMMNEPDVVEGTDLETSINQAFKNPKTAYIHLHFAKPGCFASKVTRA